MGIVLRAITPENYQSCLALSVHPDQRSFVADNVKSLAEAWVWRDMAEPWALYDGEEMVGFVLLYPLGDEEKPGFNIVRFMIDGAKQGQGLGRLALEETVKVLRARGCTWIQLSVIPENQAARRFYTRNGFKDTGEISDGELVYRLEL